MQTIVTTVVECSAAAELAEWIRSAWAIEPVQIERPGDDVCRLECYFDDPLKAELAKSVFSRMAGSRGTTLRRFEQKDYDRIWRAHFKRHQVGRGLEICPVWETDAPVPPGRTRVVVNPGMSFGTGEHFTTRFCLEMIDDVCQKSPPSSFLDVGAGSGILAIAARLSGIPRVVGVDNDALAVEQAGENAVLNGVDGGLQFEVGDILRSGPAGHYDMVCANLYARILVDSARRLADRAGRWLVVTGVREDEAESVAAAFIAQGLNETTRDGDGEWAGMMFTRKDRN
jgi:ribosomal protein L11 methyltransferase